MSVVNRELMNAFVREFTRQLAIDCSLSGRRSFSRFSLSFPVSYPFAVASDANRSKLYARLRNPILLRALTIPIVRTSSVPARIA
jgi:hypothetical protein